MRRSCVPLSTGMLPEEGNHGESTDDRLHEVYEKDAAAPAPLGATQEHGPETACSRRFYGPGDGATG